MESAPAMEVDEVTALRNAKIALAKIVKDENELRVEQCSKEINEVLQKHGCSLMASMTCTPKGNFQNIQVVIMEPTQ